MYATRINVPDYMIRGLTTWRLVTDERGSVRAAINSTTGAVDQYLRYDEFGVVLEDSNPGFQPFGFAGGLYVPDTKLVRFGARDYDPQTGRWTAKDPIGFGGGDSDLYVYASNDPVNFIDPSGLDQLTADPHVQEMIRQLWDKSGWGMRPQEQGAWVTKDPSTGTYGCVAWPQSHESNALSLKRGWIKPPNTVAIIHTHPAVGNRTQEPDDTGDRLVAHITKVPIYGNRLAGTHDDQDRLLAYGGASYHYTKNGELDLKTDGSGTTAYTYDAFGNLSTVLLPDGRRIDYVIDAQSRRVGKKVNGSLVVGWLYADQLRIVAETNGAGTITKRFVYGSRSNVPDYMIWNGVNYRIVTDHRGSPRYVVEASSGASIEIRAYDEFGNILSDTNAGLQPFGFAGGLYDNDTKLVRFGYRDYDPHAGRWTSKDPSGFSGGSTNLFEYAFGDPVNFIDVNGKNPALLIPGLVGAAAGILTVTGYQIYENVHHQRAWNACFNGSDIAIAGGIGFLAGITIPALAPTVPGAIGIGVVANLAQTVLTNLAHPGESLTGGSLAISAVAGAVSGPLGGTGSTGVLLHKFQLSMGDVLRNLGAAAASNFPTGDTAGCGCD